MKEVTMKFDEKSRHFSQHHDVNMYFVKTIFNYMSDRFKARGFLFLNDMLEELGLPRTSEGQLIGWIDLEEKKPWWEMETSTENDDIVLKFFTDGVMYDKIEG